MREIAGQYQSQLNASLVVLPRAAHLANVERANEFNKALIEHLAA